MTDLDRWVRPHLEHWERVNVIMKLEQEILIKEEKARKAAAKQDAQ